MRDRFEIGRTISVLDEEAQVIFQSIRSAGHRIAQPVRPVVLDHLARALFEVGCSDNLEVRFGGEPCPALLAMRTFGYDRVNRVSRAVHHIREHDLRAPSWAIIRQYRADRLVATFVAPGGLENWSDVFEAGIDIQALGQ